MLKSIVTADEFESLPEAVQEHYKKQGDGSYALQSEEAGRLKTALDKERRLREEADRLLGELVPDIVDDDAATGFIPRRDWRAKATSTADLLRDVRESEFDAETWTRLKSTAGDKQQSDSELQTKLQDATTQLRDAQRKLTAIEREHKTAFEELAREVTRGNRLAIERDITTGLRANKVTQPMPHRLAGLVVREQPIKTRRVDGSDEIETYVVNGDDEIPIGEWIKTWVEGDEGKNFADAVDNSGGGGVDRLLAGRNGGAPQQKKPQTPAEKKIATEGLVGERKLAAVFDGKI